MRKLLESLSRKEVLTRARAHIFSMGVRDSAERLCAENMQFGLARIHYVQEKQGLAPDATFIGAPDTTVTRNIRRWQNGFGYGGKISWGTGNDPLIILDTMPNACGMLVGGIDEIPPLKVLIERIYESLQTETIDGIPIQWDFAVSNHFINVYEIRQLKPDYEFPFQYAFMIHGSVPELKSDNDSKFGFGLYPHKSKLLAEMAEAVQTPFGTVQILTEKNAKEYFEFYKFAESLSKKKRLTAAKLIFGDFVEVCNPIHQGLLNPNEILLGCHNVLDKTAMDLFPMALRSDLPAFLLKGKRNLSEEMIEFLGFRKRAEKHGVLARLQQANILPHGGGYTFPQILRVNRVMEDENKRFFITEVDSGLDVEKAFSSPKELAFSYRGQQVLVRALELELGDVEARLIPKMVLKM